MCWFQPVDASVVAGPAWLGLRVARRTSAAIIREPGGGAGLLTGAWGHRAKPGRERAEGFGVLLLLGSWLGVQDLGLTLYLLRARI